MKQIFSTSLSAVLAASVIVGAPGLAAAQAMGAAAESGASASVGVSAAGAVVSAAPALATISVPLSPSISAFHGAPALAAPAAEPGAAAVPTAAAQPAAEAAAAPVVAAPAEAAPAAEAPAAGTEQAPKENLAEPVFRVDPADRIGGPLAQTPAKSQGGAFAGLGHLFDGWRSRGRAVDDSASAAADGAPVQASAPAPDAPSGLNPADTNTAPAAAPGVPSPRVQKAARFVGMAVSAAMLARWAAPHLTSLTAHAAPVAAWIGSIHPAVTAFAAATGGVSALIAARRSGASVGRTAASAAGGVLVGAAKAHVALDVAQMALNGLSVVGLNPYMTALSAAVLGRAAYAALSDSSLTPGARVRRALPAAVAAVLLGTQSVTTLSYYAVPQLLVASALAVSAVSAIAQAAVGRGDARAASRMSVGLTIQALALGAALFFWTTPVAWWLAGAAGIGFLLSLSGLIRAGSVARRAARVEAALRAAQPRTVKPSDVAGSETR